jgi:regulation of enolase protein 1 (concanavalin A-like superfamily)
VIDAPARDFVIETKVEFTPLDDFQRAGLLIYGDADNVLVLSRAFCSYTGAGCVLNGIYFDSTLNTVSHATETAEKDVAWLRLWKRGQDVLAEYSEDGLTWQAIGAHSLPYAGVLRVGIIADGERGEATGVPAYFDYFLLEGRT